MQAGIDRERLALKRAMDVEDRYGIPVPTHVRHISHGFTYPYLGQWREYWVVQVPSSAAPPILVNKAQWHPVYEREDIVTDTGRVAED